MRTLMISGLMLGMVGVGAPVAQASDSVAGNVLPVAAKAYGKAGGMHQMHTMRSMPRWGHRINGRWHGGVRAPGGWHGYRRPVRGFILPRYWIQPSYYIGNYSLYGLRAPAYGYGWSRYYDDAVLTDRYGRVYDTRHDVRWDRYEGGYADDNGYDDGYRGEPYYADGRRYDDRYDNRYEKRDNGLGGALIGGAVGALAGNRIAGRGNRTEGTIIGGAVGAIAGAAIDVGEDRGNRGPDSRAYRDAPPPPAYDNGRGHYDTGYGRDDSVTYNNEYKGTWVGTWHGEDGTTYSGTYKGQYAGTARSDDHDARGVGYDTGATGSVPHWAMDTHPSMNGGTQVHTGHGGYISGGYYYPAPTITTITIQPAVTTTFVEETITYTTVKKPARARKVWKAKPRCMCK